MDTLSLQFVESAMATEILVAADLFVDLPRFFAKKYDPKLTRVFVVTDTNLKELYLDKFAEAIRAAGFLVEILVVPAGEASKSLTEYVRLVDELVALKIDRKAVIVGFGGGVVTDLAGFLASTILRGVDLCLCPTSLLAQVDAAVGGKTGLDLLAAKNMVGTFYPATSLFLDFSVLTTLPEVEFLAGMSELVKHALIADRELAMDLLAFSDDYTRLLEAERSVVFADLIKRSLSVKLRIVEADFREQNVRKYLNLGHTTAHALEVLSAYRLGHGAAVARGVVFEAILAKNLGYLAESELGLVFSLFKQLMQLSEANSLNDVVVSELFAVMQTDKKNVANEVCLVLLKEIGKPELVFVDLPNLKSSWEEFLTYVYGE